jgi:hypothetical protein
MAWEGARLELSVHSLVELLSRHSSGGTEENHEYLHKGYDQLNGNFGRDS